MLVSSFEHCIFFIAQFSLTVVIKSYFWQLDSCRSAFEADEPFDYVINLAAETRLGQSDNVYKQGIFNLSTNCISEARRTKVKKYLEISTALSSDGSEPLTEDAREIGNLMLIEKYKLQVEKELSQIDDLNWIVLRPAFAYGIADKGCVTQHLVFGAIYSHLKETMNLLWNADLKTNTVHVKDLCRAIWFVLQSKDANHRIFNVVDKGNTSQDTVANLVSKIFKINYDYWGKTKSQLAFKLNGSQTVVEEINDKHMKPWLEMCAKYCVLTTPLNPYLYAEVLQYKHLHVNGEKLELLGFKYEVPRITIEKMLEILNDFIDMKLFPKVE